MPSWLNTLENILLKNKNKLDSKSSNTALKRSKNSTKTANTLNLVLQSLPIGPEKNLKPKDS